MFILILSLIIYCEVRFFYYLITIFYFKLHNLAIAIKINSFCVFTSLKAQIAVWFQNQVKLKNASYFYFLDTPQVLNDQSSAIFSGFALLGLPS